MEIKENEPRPRPCVWCVEMKRRKLLPDSWQFDTNIITCKQSVGSDLARAFFSQLQLTFSTFLAISNRAVYKCQHDARADGADAIILLEGHITLQVIKLRWEKYLPL